LRLPTGTFEQGRTSVSLKLIPAVLQHSFALPDDACALDAPNSDEEAPPNEVPSRKEGTEFEQDNQEQGSATGPSTKTVHEREMGRVVELVVILTAEEFDELMTLARQRTREAQ
jgi:hypothetical protein